MEAAIAELTKLHKTSYKLGTVKDYTMQFNPIIARTKFGMVDKCKHYYTGLPYKIKDIFAQGAHDIDDLKKIQRVVLSINQALIICEEKHPKQFGWRKKGEKAAATSTGKKPFKGSHYNCSKEEYCTFQHPKPKSDRQ